MEPGRSTQELPAADTAGTKSEDRDERARPPGLIALALAGMLAGTVVALWLVDLQVTRGQVARNVSVGGRAVGGMNREELSVILAALAQDYARSPVEITVAGGVVNAQASELGLALRQDQTAAGALRVGQEGSFPGRFVRWLTSFFRPRTSPVVVRVDPASVERVLAERDPGRVAPVEPTLGVRDGRIVALPGSPGRGADPGAATPALLAAAARGLPVRASVGTRELRPRFALEDVERLAQQAEALASRGLLLRAGTVTSTLSPALIRGLLTAQPEGDSLRLVVDRERLRPALAALFPTVGRPVVDASFTVSGGQVVITPSRTGLRCCAPQATAMVEAALLRGGVAGALELPVEVIQPRRDEAAAQRLGIVEPVGSFTTSHAPGEPRVRNIHRMADLVRGAVIEPGRTFSLNGHVGPRTAAKGFVEAPVIDEHMKFSSDVGGGVSQFATTMFNAAFFAGLDITGYGMHSLYISRYPFGREATLAYPDLDLKIRNNTPHGVLIWPTYSGSSITVTLYSTKTVVGEQTGQTSAPKGPCTSVVTERTRRYTDGRSAVDKFYALYAPEEGVSCR